jgi:hypothetical protein
MGETNKLRSNDKGVFEVHLLKDDSTAVLCQTGIKNSFTQYKFKTGKFKRNHINSCRRSCRKYKKKRNYGGNV